MPYGKSRFGDTIYAGEGSDPDPPPPTITTGTISRRGAFGYGTWVAQIVERGGGAVLMEVPYTAVRTGGAVNGSAPGNVDIPVSGLSRSALCQVLEDVEPWRDELLLWRGDHLAFAGPVKSLTGGLGGGAIESADLFSWMEKRFVPDLYVDGDTAHCFQTIFNAAMNPDPSPNITLQTRLTGVQSVQNFTADQFHRAADALRSLTTFGIDFTMVGRTLLAGGKEVFESTDPLLLHDEGVSSASVSKNGDLLMTDAAVVGSNIHVGGSPPTGRAIRGDATYGLVQASYSELLIQDSAAAEAAALAHLDAGQPVPRMVTAILSPEAAFTYPELIAGRRVDVRLSNVAGCMSVMEEMRLVSYSVSVTAGEGGYTEEVTVELVPLGVGNDN